MPKQTLRIDKFEGGLATHKFERDIADNELVEAQDVMVDIEGKIRSMGSSFVYDPAVGSGLLNSLTGLVTPGFGLFSFGADHDINNNAKEIKIIAIQNAGKINLFDTSEHSAAISINTDQSQHLLVEPIFYYINESLRICDTNFLNTNSNNKVFTYIERTFFANNASNPLHALPSGSGEWIDVNQEIATPANTANLDTDGADDGGFIKLTVAEASDDAGEWNSADLGALQFGYTYLYDEDTGFGKQESKIKNYSNTFSLSGAEDRRLNITVSINANLYTSGLAAMGFPERVTGFRIYWVGEGSNTFEEPLMLLEGDFNRGTNNDGVIVAHNNQEQLLAYDSSGSPNVYKNASVLTIPEQPVLTYELLNGYKHDVESITAKYKSAIIVNNTCYIGNIQQNDRVYADRMIKSPVGKFDTFPSSNFLDVAIGDGDSITALAEHADRLLQFKSESLYIINLSGDYEYVEDHQIHKGVLSQAAVVKTAEGVAWVNKNGCYLYNGERTLDLIGNKIDPNEWKNFIGTKGMIGYLTRKKQLIISGNPSAAGAQGNVYIFDMRTQSWTKGLNKLSPLSKSNFISTYKGDTLIAFNQLAESENISVELKTPGSNPRDGVWAIESTGNSSVVNTKLQLNSNDITNVFSYSSDEPISLAQKIKNEIAVGPQKEYISVDWDESYNLTEPNPLLVRLPGYLTDDTPVNLSGNLQFTVLPSQGVSTTYSQPSISLLINSDTVPAGDANSRNLGFQLAVPSNLSDNLGTEGNRTYYLKIKNNLALNNNTYKDFASLHVPQIGQELLSNQSSILYSGISGNVSIYTGAPEFNMSQFTGRHKLGSIGGNNNFQFNTPYEGDNSFGDPFYQVFLSFNEEWTGPEYYPVDLPFGSILDGQTFTMTAASAIIDDTVDNEYFNEDATHQIWISNYEARLNYSAGDIITLQYNNLVDDYGTGTNIYDGVQFNVIGAIPFSGEYTTNTLDPRTDAGWPNTQFTQHAANSGWTCLVVSQLNDFVTLGQESIHSSLTIVKQEANGQPTIVQAPSAGSGEIYSCKVIRNGSTSADIVYRLGIDTANNDTDEILFTTSAGHTSQNVVNGLISLIDNAGWVDSRYIANRSGRHNLTATYTAVASNNSITGPGLIDAGFEAGMEITFNSQAGANANKTFYIVGISAGDPNDTITVNSSSTVPYAGLDTLSDQSATLFAITGAGFTIQNIPPNPDHSSLVLSGYSYSDKITIEKFENDSDNSNSNIIITTKEIDFGNISSTNNINSIYITHNLNHSIGTVEYRTDNHGFTYLQPQFEDGINIQGMSTYKYIIREKNARIIQIRIKSSESNTYELNDISIVYREKVTK